MVWMLLVSGEKMAQLEPQRLDSQVCHELRLKASREITKRPSEFRDSRSQSLALVTAEYPSKNYSGLVFEFADVAFDEFGCCFAVACPQRFEDGAVLGESGNQIGLVCT
jgi:hypothetical protein